MGNILIDQKIATPDQITAVMEMQSKNGDEKMGSILVELAVLTSNQLEDALFVQRKRRGKTSKADVVDFMHRKQQRQSKELAADYRQIGELALALADDLKA